MPSITNMIDIITQLDSPFITVHQNRCVLVRNRNADCLKCADVCTSGCISFDGEELQVSPERCIGCGTCATACPTCCLEAHHPTDTELLATCKNIAQASPDGICIACAELLERAKNVVDSAKIARVECLGRVDESLLCTLVAQGITTINLVHGACESCPHHTGRDMIERVLEGQHTLLQAWNTPATIRLTPRFPSSCRLEKSTFDKAKREAFTQGKDDVFYAGASVFQQAITAHPEKSEPPSRFAHQKVMEDGTLPHFLPDRRERMLDALAQLGTPQDTMIETRLWGHVIIDTDMCSSCRMCAVFCPTGALRKFDAEDGSFGVTHYPGDCVKCRLCTTICPEGALTLSEEVFAREMLEGMTDAYEMKPIAIKRGQAHTIWHTAKTFTNIEEVYER